MLTGETAFAASPAVVLEYEDVVKRPGLLGPSPWISFGEIDAILDALCAMAKPSLPWFRFRPLLDDPKDDLYVECALAAGADVIVSDDRHFSHPIVAALGLKTMGATAFAAALVTRRMK
jgi:predicted nucleic acid-binding protein